MKLSIPPNKKKTILDSLYPSNQPFDQNYAEDLPTIQPIQTLYESAATFSFNSAVLAKETAQALFNDHLSDPNRLVEVFGIDTTNGLHQKVYEKVGLQLDINPVQDLRIDFEDGYGDQPNEQEDQDATRCAKEVAQAVAEDCIFPSIGIRVKGLTEDVKERCVRTLDIFLTTLLAETNGKLPANFVVVLPKVQIKEHVSAFTGILAILEETLDVASGSIIMEFMVETTQAVIGPDGNCPLRSFVEAANGRCQGVHFGTYDYTKTQGISPIYQQMDHSVCDFAHHVMKTALNETGVWLSDGSTNTLPVGDERAVLNAWQLQYRHVRHSLFKGLYQGWDLHPGQLIPRYVANYAFYLEQMDSVLLRLRNYFEQRSANVISGGVVDDAATVVSLKKFMNRAMNCGAIAEEEVKAYGIVMENINS